jgi:hypothetical protein
VAIKTTSSSPSSEASAPFLRRFPCFLLPAPDILAQHKVETRPAASTSHSAITLSEEISQIVTLSADPRTGWARANWVREELKADNEGGGGGAWEATGCLGREGPAVG